MSHEQTNLLAEVGWVAPPPPEPFTTDDWETPDDIAKALADLVRLDERVVEVGAGGGQISQYLYGSPICVESSVKRVARGREKAQHCKWVEEDFFHWAARQRNNCVDCFIANPPFSIALDLVEAALPLLATKGRFLLLLPTEFFQSQTRAAQLRALGLVISNEWRIAGRVAYLKLGVSHPGRQCYDSIFELRPRSQAKAAVKVIDPMGRLK
ncbi:MAG: class I SAM-dependent methyltransferase [Cyanobacteria bacterium J06635_1]